MTTNTQLEEPALFPMAFEIKNDLELKPDYENELIKNYASHQDRVLVSLHKQSTGDKGEMETVIHLIRMDAIKLTVTHKYGSNTLTKTEVRVDLLMGRLDDYQTSKEDLDLVLNILTNLVSPLLLFRHQSIFIIPQSCGNEKRIRIPIWTMFKFRMHLNSVRVSSLRNLGHPATKNKAILTENGLIRLGQAKNHWILLLEDTMTHQASLDHKKYAQTPLCVTLTISGDRLRSILSRSGFSISQSLLGSQSIDLAHVVNKEMSKMKGRHLPVPQGDASDNLITKFARVIALETKGKQYGSKALLSTAEKVFANYSGSLVNPSFSEFTALKKAVLTESARIKSSPVSSLFTIEAITTSVTPWKFYLDVPVHSLVTSAQGQDVEPE